MYVFDVTFNLWICSVNSNAVIMFFYPTLSAERMFTEPSKQSYDKGFSKAVIVTVSVGTALCIVFNMLLKNTNNENNISHFIEYYVWYCFSCVIKNIPVAKTNLNSPNVNDAHAHNVLSLPFCCAYTHLQVFLLTWIKAHSFFYKGLHF